MPKGVYKRTEKHKKAISKAKKGVKNPRMARKGKRNGMYGVKGMRSWRNISGLCKGFHGKHSEETKIKMSVSKLVKNPSYSALHSWVRRWKGKPTNCINCKTNTKSRKYEWANLSGKYKRDLTDYGSMCISCHRKFDKQRSE